MKLSTNNLMKVLMAIVVASLIGMFSACTGPEGPSGANGANGADGSSACKNCHGKDDVEFKFSQYEISKHGTGVIYEEEAGRLQCGGCHTGDGFAEAAKNHADDPTTKATSKIDCKACHTIHDSYDSTDFGLRITSGFKLRHSGADVDFGKGNTCAKCHQARPYSHNKAGWDTLKSSGTATYSRFGPHYGVVANVVAMKGLEEVTGKETIPTSNPHGSLSCTTCHMGSDATDPAKGGHTFKMPVLNLANANKTTNCAGACHTAADMNKTAGVVADVKKLLAQTRTRLLYDLKMLDTSQTFGAEGYNILGEYAAGTKTGLVYKSDDPKFKAMINYLFLAKDRSMGVHNPAYVKALLKNGLDELNK